jgi:hypothetical protein
MFTPAYTDKIGGGKCQGYFMFCYLGN